MKGEIRHGFALVWMAALLLVAAAFFGLNGWMERPASAFPARAAATVEPPLAEVTLDAAQAVTARPVMAVPSEPKIVSQGPVTVLDLDQLAAAVNLREADMGASKQVWAAELPVAQALLQRPCDCDQRNWLKHYVKTAGAALSGSEDYASSIQLLATLRRGDADLVLSSSASR